MLSVFQSWNPVADSADFSVDLQHSHFQCCSRSHSVGRKGSLQKKSPRYIQICYTLYRYRMISISCDILQTFQLSLKSHSLPVHGSVRAPGSSSFQGACSFLGSFSAPSSHYCPGCLEETSGHISTSGAIRWRSKFCWDTNKYGWFMTVHDDMFLNCFDMS